MLARNFGQGNKTLQKREHEYRLKQHHKRISQAKGQTRTRRERPYDEFQKQRRAPSYAAPTQAALRAMSVKTSAMDTSGTALPSTRAGTGSRAATAPDSPSGKPTPLSSLFAAAAGSDFIEGYDDVDGGSEPGARCARRLLLLAMLVMLVLVLVLLTSQYTQPAGAPRRERGLGLAAPRDEQHEQDGARRLARRRRRRRRRRWQRRRAGRGRGAGAGA